jgi:membrane protein
MRSLQVWQAGLNSARHHMKRDRVSVAAGAFAYRWFLSLFPVIIALLGVAAIVDLPHDVTVSLIRGVTKALPSGAASVITGAISHTGSRSGAAVWATIIATCVALWSATSGMVMVEEGLDMAYEVPADRSFAKKRLLAIPLLIGATLLGGCASALIVFGPQLGSAIKGRAPLGGEAFLVAWIVVRWVIALGLTSLLFSLLYSFALNRVPSRWCWVSPGSIVGTAIWALVSVGFSFYTSSFSSYDKTYGAFAGVAILIFWLYLTGLAILIGGEINAAFERLLQDPDGTLSTPRRPSRVSDGTGIQCRHLASETSEGPTIR